MGNVMRNQTFILIVFLWCTVATAEEESRIGADTNKNIKPLVTAEEALAQALKITGFKGKMTVELATAEEIVRKVVITDDETPFFSDRINGHRLWQITFDSVDLRSDLSRSRRPSKWPLKSFDVLLDPETGQVLRIHAGYADKEDGVMSEPPAKLAEELLRESGEIYHDIPRMYSDITFFHAARAAIGCSPWSAKEIFAQYVLHSKGDASPKPIWCITCRGIKRVQFTNWGKGSTRERCVVDASTSEWMFMTNRPHGVPE